MNNIKRAILEFGSEQDKERVRKAKITEKTVIKMASKQINELAKDIVKAALEPKERELSL